MENSKMCIYGLIGMYIIVCLVGFFTADSHDSDQVDCQYHITHLAIVFNIVWLASWLILSPIITDYRKEIMTGCIKYFTYAIICIVVIVYIAAMIIGVKNLEESDECFYNETIALIFEVYTPLILLIICPCGVCITNRIHKCCGNSSKIHPK